MKKNLGTAAPCKKKDFTGYYESKLYHFGSGCSQIQEINYCCYNQSFLKKWANPGLFLLFIFVFS